MSDYRSKKIIIVGAGIAGLFCAEELRKCGFKNISILEASGRIGGRIHTFNVKRSNADREEYHRIELGPQHIDRGTNLIYEYATRTELLDSSSPNYFDALKNLRSVYNEDQESIINDLIFFFSNLHYFPKCFEDVAESKEFWEKFKHHEESILIYYAKGVYDWYRNLVYDYTFLPVELKYGFADMLISFVKTFPKRWIIGHKEVIRIDWTEMEPKEFPDYAIDPKIKVYCRDDETLYEADHIIITVPLGYLKQNVETLFVPSLPTDKINAIQSLDFVTVNKIFLVFDNPFWKIPDVFHVIWNKTLEELFGYDVEDSQGQKNWVHCITHFEYVKHNPNVLLAWIWNEGAEIMEKLSAVAVSLTCMKLLEHLLQKPLPKPRNIIRSTWHSNSFYCGSLPYDCSRDTRPEISTIAESVYGGVSGYQPVLLFAGDATNKLDMACVHGAAATGVRAAHSIYAFYHDMYAPEGFSDPFRCSSYGPLALI